MNGVVMSGSLGEFDVPSILQAVSLSRQCTLLRLWDHDQRETGEIRVKAGQLLGATCGEHRGRAALYSLLCGQHQTFRVERFADPVNLPAPVGPLAAMLLEMPRPVPAPALRLPTAPDAVPATLETINASMPRAADERLRALTALEAVVVCKAADGLQCWAWARGGGLVVDLCAVVRMVVGSEIPPVRTMVEFDGAIAVVQPLGEHAVVAYGFAGSTPLGLIRMVVQAAHAVAAAGSAGAEAGPL